MKRVLVGVLSTGEPSLPKALAAVRAQSNIETELFQVKDLPEREAHRELYEKFSALSERFDLIAKVDADMEIVHRGLFAALGTLFDHFPEKDFAPVAVDDWLSGRQIWSLNVWRGGTRWLEDPPELFTDLVENTAQDAFPLLKVGEPLVLHATEPTPLQALRYGARRAAKASSSRDPGRIRAVERTVQFCESNPVFERDLVLVGIACALQDPEFSGALTSMRDMDGTVERAIDAASDKRTEELADEAQAQLRKLRRALVHQDSGPQPGDRRESPTIRRAWGTPETRNALPRVRNSLRRSIRRLRPLPDAPNTVLHEALGRMPTSEA